MHKESKKVLHLTLNSINESNDPTKVGATFIILDFDKSFNNAIIEKEIAMGELAQSIMSKPIVAHYNETDSDNPDDDSFEGHNPYLDEDKHGDTVIKLDTVPIGVFTTEGYIMEIDTEDGKKEVLAADAILWKDRFTEPVELLQEWHNRGININTSCELLYSNFEVSDGVEYLKAPVWFSGHCILNSEERGGQSVVLPAYNTSRLVSFNELKEFNRLVAQAMDQKEKKEDEQMPELFKKVFELSHNDTRTALYRVFDETLEANQYSWIRDVYEDKFVVDIETSTENSYKSETFQFNYSKSEDDKLVVDLESKVAVMPKTEWVALNEVQELHNQLEEKETAIQSLNSEKEELQGKFNETSEKLISLNSTLEELQEYKEKFEKARFEEQLQEKTEYYSAKFSAVGATEKFESEEVQGLVEKSVTDSEAVFQLNSMLVDLVELKEEKKKEEAPVVQLNSKRKDLIPTATDFDSRYQ